MFARSSHIIWGEIEPISGNSQSNSDKTSRRSGSNESASKGKKLTDRHLLMDVEIRKSSESISAGSFTVQNNPNTHDAEGGDDMWSKLRSAYDHMAPDFAHILFGSSSGSSSRQDASASQSTTKMLPRPEELVAAQIEPPAAAHAEFGPDASLMSIGSALHWKNECRPCLFARTKLSCVHGASCQFCHFVHSRKTKPSKEKRERYRRIARANETTHGKEPILVEF